MPKDQGQIAITDAPADIINPTPQEYTIHEFLLRFQRS